jgi:hypothetical protein
MGQMVDQHPFKRRDDVGIIEGGGGGVENLHPTARIIGRGVQKRLRTIEHGVRVRHRIARGRPWTGFRRLRRTGGRRFGLSRRGAGRDRRGPGMPVMARASPVNDSAASYA